MPFMHGFLSARRPHIIVLYITRRWQEFEHSETSTPIRRCAGPTCAHHHMVRENPRSGSRTVQDRPVRTTCIREVTARRLGPVCGTNLCARRLNAFKAPHIVPSRPQRERACDIERLQCPLPFAQGGAQTARGSIRTPQGPRSTSPTVSENLLAAHPAPLN